MRTEYPADRALRPYVECLWSVERTFAPPADTFTLLPDCHVELVFSAGARFTVAAGDAEPELPRAYVVGLLDAPMQLRARGTMRAVAARCHAWSAAPLLAPLLAPPDAGAPVAGAIHPLRAAHATLGDAIAERLEVGDVAGALGRLTDALRALVAAAPAIPAHVRRAGQALTGTLDRTSDPTLGAESGAALGDTSGAMVGGAMRRGAPVRRAAAASGRTPRHLERQFRALAGVTPKAYARHARFEQVRDRLWAEPQTSLSALAAECGYADQAHLTREFGAYAGVPPARWAAGIARTRALLHGGADPARQVAFLQDD